MCRVLIMNKGLRNIVAAFAVSGSLTVAAADFNAEFEAKKAEVTTHLGSVSKAEVIAEAVKLVKVANEADRGVVAEASITTIADFGERALLLAVSAIGKEFPELAGNIAKAAVVAAPELSERVVARLAMVAKEEASSIVFEAVKANPEKMAEVSRIASFIAPASREQIVSAVTRAAPESNDVEFFTSAGLAGTTGAGVVISVPGSTFSSGSIVPSDDDVPTMQPSIIIGGAADRQDQVTSEVRDGQTVTVFIDGNGNELVIDEDGNIFDQYGNPV